MSFVGMEHCVSSLWVCLLPFKTRTLCAVCIDKTHEYLSGAIYHLTPLAPSSYTKAIFTLFLILCRCSELSAALMFTRHVDNVAGLIPSHSLSPHFYVPSLSALVFHPIEKWRTRCRCSVSSSARPSASLMSAWPLWSCPLMFWGTRHAAFYSPVRCAPFCPNSSAATADLKHVPNFLSLSFLTCLRRALLTGLTSNPHINDLHLDISGCEVRVHLHLRCIPSSS